MMTCPIRLPHDILTFHITLNIYYHINKAYVFLFLYSGCYIDEYTISYKKLWFNFNRRWFAWVKRKHICKANLVMHRLFIHWYVCAIRLPLWTCCLFTHAKHLGSKLFDKKLKLCLIIHIDSTLEFFYY